jgi:hypothetical protein
MKRVLTIALGAVLLLGAVWALSVVAAGELLTWWTADGGGGESSGGRWIVRGTAGQPDAGASLAGGSYEVVGGFWGGRGLETEITVSLPLVLRDR